MADQVTYQRIYCAGLEAAVSLASCSADTPMASNAWLRGYLDAHCALLASMTDQTAGEWRTTLQRLATAKFAETMKRLEAL
jgi:hypothetical protein